MRRLAVAADDVCTIADRAYRYVPIEVGLSPLSRRGIPSCRILGFASRRAVDQLSSRGVDDIVVYGGRRSIHERACRVWPLSHVGSEGRSSGRGEITFRETTVKKGKFSVYV